MVLELVLQLACSPQGLETQGLSILDLFEGAEKEIEEHCIQKCLLRKNSFLVKRTIINFRANLEWISTVGFLTSADCKMVDY